ncbi:RnlA-like RNase toxin of RnlAB toxin-antitoxin system [Salegentibacter sp. 24]|jgi:hypothetical protein|uniref:type II toxin-antitoxin system RnlA family toxin n=1 Tax=Salegentibacter sp. 24 TaxID=2183986 RepID=UPI00105D5DED|nr:type II toxin-antitoxin system RnlA family toxin [Salegentibacter sp. 24]TDN93375.1 RnlA-like RNase toxin of RnlAB toxin-antitoxin system [Salegentibacter sp. 24]
MSFKKLNLNRAKIQETLENFLESSVDISLTQKAEGFHVYKFISTGYNPASLNIYFNGDGTTTLQPNTGKNVEWSTSIATTIVENCSVKVFNANSFYLKAIRDEDFQVVLEFLAEECEAEILSDKNNKIGRHIKLKGKQGDGLVLNHYKNGAFQAQGKPRMLFHDAIMILSELLPFKEVINTQLEFYETKLTSDDIIGELENRLPVSSDHLDEKIKSVISPSIALRKTDLALTDYAVFAFPILRGIEGVMKQLFASKGKLVTKDGFGPLFEDRGISLTFSSEVKQDIKSREFEKAVCDLYSFYKTQRHSLFHMDGTVSTSKTLDRSEAEHIINTGINVIESSYTILKS